MRARWLLSRLRREPVAAWPRRAWSWARPTVGWGPSGWPTPRSPFRSAVPGAPPPEPQMPDDLRASWSRDRGQRSAFATLRGEAAPPFPSGQPANAHEAAFRLVSAVVCGGDVAALAGFVAAHRSRGTSARNHAVAERAALALAVRVLPTHPDVEAWRRVALELPALLAREVGDGTGVEAALGYHVQNLEWGLLAWWAGVPGLEGALALGAEVALDFVDSAGNLPDRGDDDDGTVFPATLTHRDRLAVVLQALGLPAPAGYTPGFVAGLLGSPPVVGHRAPTSRTTPSSTVLRRGPHVVVLAHGPFGAGPQFAHAHADALGVWWAPDGRWAVGGRGTHRYLGDPHDRRFRRGSQAVATVVVDGRDLAEPHDHPFLWRSTCGGELVSVDLAGATVTARTTDRVRTVTLGADGALSLVDTVGGSGRHHVALQFPARPGARLQVSPPPGFEVRERAEQHSPRYGHLEPAFTWVAEGVVELPIRLVTTVRTA